MTVKLNVSRSAFVRRRRSQPKTPRQTQTAKRPPLHERVHLGAPARRTQPSRVAPVGRTRAQARQYAFSLGRADVRAPALSLPEFGPRWVSGLAMALLVFLLIMLWTSSTFAVAGTELHGNQRLSAGEVDAALGLVGQPIFKAVPAQIETRLLSDFPELSAVHVRAGLPNRLVVDIVERTPVLAWSQAGQLTWIDAQGMAFKPQGQVQGLIPVTASGTPPQVQVEPGTPLFERPFLAPETVQTMQTLYPYVPKDVSMTYDPQYGLGWQDSRGWSVYFGNNMEDISMKLQVYQAIADSFTHQGIHASLISVEYVDAPFFK